MTLNDIIHVVTINDGFQLVVGLWVICLLPEATVSLLEFIFDP